MFYLSEAEMHAGNCSAIKQRATTDFGYSYGGLEYIPSLDAAVTANGFDYTSNTLYLLDLSTNTTSEMQQSEISSTNWWYSAYMEGEFYYQPNGTLWAMGDEYGPGPSLLFTIELGNNITAIKAGNQFNGTGIRTTLPRTLRAISDGPAPTVLNKWRTGFDGAVMLVTPDNDLFVVNIDTPAVRNITRLSTQVIAIESFGSWNQIYAVVNGTSGPSLALVNITTGALTNVATLPGLYRSLTMGADGKMLAMTRADGSANVTLVQITSAGQVTQVAEFACTDVACNKVWSDGVFYYFSSASSYSYTRRNITDLSPQTPLGFNANCPDYDADGANGCTGASGQFSYIKVSDMSYHPASQGMLWTSILNNGITSILRHNTTINRWKTVVDFHHVATDIAYFQYDRAWCSNRGDWNGDICVCDNAGIAGSRCQTILPAPVAPPVAVPVAAPVATPVAAPVAAAGAPQKSAIPVAAAASVASNAIFCMLLVSFIALFA
jgi:hypothetical protein